MDQFDLGVTAVNHMNDPSKDGPESFVQKKARVRNELAKCGASNYGLRKFNSRYLPKLIGNHEHIHAVIYGRYSEGSGILNYVDRMAVATDDRLINLNHKPGYTDTEEFTYDVVEGVELSQAGPFVAVKVSTKARKFTIRFVNKRCGRNFVRYVEKRRQEYFEGTLNPRK